MVKESITILMGVLSKEYSLMTKKLVMEFMPGLSLVGNLFFESTPAPLASISMKTEKYSFNKPGLYPSLRFENVSVQY